MASRKNEPEQESPEETPAPEPQPEPETAEPETGFPCPCGSRHELDPDIARLASADPITIVHAAEGTWRIPRVFLAAHDASQLAEAAAQYGFEEA
jgi:hypothetical protein